MKTDPLLVLPQNETHGESLAALVPLLLERSVPIRVLDYQAVYHQLLDLGSLGVEVVPTTIRSDRAYYRLGSWGRARLVQRARAEIRAHVERSAGVLAFNDGALQRVALLEARRLGIPTALLLDGMISDYGRTSWRAAPRIALEKLGRSLMDSQLNTFLPSEIGMSRVDVMFVIGRHSADVLRRRGALATQILASGLPRWPEETRLDRCPERVSRVLYLTGAFAWHGDPRTDLLEARDVAALADICEALSIALDVRVHPRADPGPYRGLGITISAADEPMSASIRRADLVMSLVSTGLLEAIWLGRAAQVLCLNPDWDRFARSFAAAPMLIPIRSKQQLATAMVQYRDSLSADIYRNQREALVHYVAADGPSAARRIADALASILMLR